MPDCDRTKTPGGERAAFDAGLILESEVEQTLPGELIRAFGDLPAAIGHRFQVFLLHGDRLLFAPREASSGLASLW